MNGRGTAAAAIVAALALAPLGALQFVATVALRDAGVSGSWVRAMPPATAVRLEERFDGWALPPVLRLIVARRALAEGDLSRTARLLERLPPSADRSALAGTLAERRGDDNGAIAAYLAASDVDDVERVVGDLQRHDKIAEALFNQRALIDHLARDPSQTGALPEAYYQLGILEQALAYHMPVGSKARADDERLALASYQRALAYAPLAERYWIAVGNQQLNVADLSGAAVSFRRAIDIDPRSAEGFVGLADVAARQGRLRDARALLERAARIEPNAGSLKRLRARIR
ncbi:MAG: tetratricopeptide repeat protein [Candidatus Eremiobacteraeota bacterium]|nr:tetratricopeptide repeat protein [Candidatus Eremiobacteraeota bacterium]